jgi:nicotinate-nucleotide adenylyltransferase
MALNSRTARERARIQMEQVDRVGVFGGTFDPVHVGHLIVAEILRHRLALSRIIFLPAGRPPHKPAQELASDEDRINMLALSIGGSPHFSISTLALSIGGSPHFSISTIDIDRIGPSYTSESLRMLRDQIGHLHELYFLMGQDSLRDFPSWHRPDLIARQARFGVARSRCGPALTCQSTTSRRLYRRWQGVLNWFLSH